MNQAIHAFADCPDTPEWKFVRDHFRTIERYSLHKQFRRTYSDPGEFRQDLVLDLVDAFHLFDPKRGAPTTWIFTRAKKVRLYHTRRWIQAKRHDGLDVLNEPSAPADADHWCVLRDAAVLAERILDLAETPGQADAAMSVMEGWTGEEVVEILGISRGTRNYHLRKLAARVREVMEIEDVIDH
jgi:DNA-directed RNA polymerase specialized sigma24 family protein